MNNKTNYTFKNAAMYRGVLKNKKKHLNKNIFVFNQKINNWTAKKDTNETDTNSKSKYQVIEEGMYLKVKIINKKFLQKNNDTFYNRHV